MKNHNYKNIPAELKDIPHWVLWQKPRVNGKFGKVPYSTNGVRIGVTGKYKTRWATFDKVLAALERGDYGGVGFVFTDTPYSGIDLDNCFMDGRVTPFAKDIIEHFNSYTERSPSGEGIHIIVKGTLPKGKRKTAYQGNKIEMFKIGYFTMTGNVYGEVKPIRECQDAIDDVYTKYFTPVEVKRNEGPFISGESILTDEEVIQKAGQGKNGALFQSLWSGDLSNHNDDHSSADLALCNILSFYCSRDMEQMDSLFRDSGLMRDKWDEVHRGDGATYGQMTLEKAINGCREVYNSRSQILKAFPSNLKFTRMSQIKREYAEYLFYPYIPKGKLTLIAGLSGGTKTWMCLYLATIIANGGKFITDKEGASDRQPGVVLYQTRENDYPTDVRARLDVLGANLNNIIMLNEDNEDGKGQPLTLSDSRLKEAIQEQGIQLLILDPIQSYLGADIDMHRANEVRPILDKLISVSAETGCAIILVSHVNKDTNKSALDRILGSCDIRNAARSILFIGGDPDNDQQRILAHAKNSLGQTGRSIAYHIDDKAYGVIIDGFAEFDEDDIIKSRQKITREKPSKTLKEAEEMLLGKLDETGYADLDDIRNLGISQSTLYAARNKMNIKSINSGFGSNKKSYWYMGMGKEDVKKLIAEREALDF